MQYANPSLWKFKHIDISLGNNVREISFIIEEKVSSFLQRNKNSFARKFRLSYNILENFHIIVTPII